jgi:hypothetical protein
MQRRKMQLPLNKTLILFGRSPFISKIADFIPILQEKYFNVGINNFPCVFPDVDLWAFVDCYTIYGIKDHYQNQKIITHYINEKELKENNFNNYELYYLKWRNRPILDKDLKILSYYGLTHTIILNWAYLNGFERVILAGVDLDTKNNKHFDNKEIFVPGSNTIINCIEQIENTYKDKLEILQLNPKTKMNIPIISVKDLI